MIRRRPWLLFLIALAVRLVYLAGISDAPYFDVPLVDGANYFGTAEAIAAGDLLGGSRAFWQPPLYPYFLALLLSLFGPRMVWIYLVQAIVGALSCWLTYRIGRRLFGEREAIAAALIMAFYGPLIYFDAQPLIPVLHIVLTMAGLLLLLRAAGIGPGDVRAGHQRRTWGAAGLAWGLSAIATPNLLLVVPGAALWAAGRQRDAGRPLRGAGGVCVALFLAGVALPVLAVTLRNLAVSGEPVLVSSNGGINLYIGNNADYERTIRIRPGGEFEMLAQEPEHLGIVGDAARSRYFTGRALAFLSEYPGPAFRLYVRKVRDLIAGREIPRNQDSYAYREHSKLLSVLLWRYGIAFPFGLVAPLALAGAVIGAGERGRSGRRLLWIYAAAYAVSIVLFFPTGRYRLPLIPIMALFAGNLLGAGIARGQRRAAAVALVAGLVLFNADAFTAGERWPEEEALNRAYALRVKGRIDDAREAYRLAIALNPRRIDPHNALAAIAAREGRWADAAAHYRDLLEIAPDFVEVRRNLGQAYLALGMRDEARREWETAIHLAPGAAPALTDLCLSYLDEGRVVRAEPYCERAVRRRPDLAETHFALGLVARAMGNLDLARAELHEAARLAPEGSRGRIRAEEMLGEMLGE